MAGIRAGITQAKLFNAERCDALFVLVGDGRRWFMPTTEVEGKRSINLGGAKYSEFEIDPGAPIHDLVYGTKRTALESGSVRGSAGVWRAGRDCKFRALALSEFESHLPHLVPRGPRNPAVGRTRISANHQVTVPKAPFGSAGLSPGDLMRVEALEDGTILMRKISSANATAADSTQPTLGTLGQ